MLIETIFLVGWSLKPNCSHFDENFVIGCTGSCQNVTKMSSYCFIFLSRRNGITSTLLRITEAQRYHCKRRWILSLVPPCLHREYDFVCPLCDNKREVEWLHLSFKGGTQPRSFECVQHSRTKVAVDVGGLQVAQTRQDRGTHNPLFAEWIQNGRKLAAP